MQQNLTDGEEDNNYTTYVQEEKRNIEQTTTPQQKRKKLTEFKVCILFMMIIIDIVINSTEYHYDSTSSLEAEALVTICESLFGYSANDTLLSSKSKSFLLQRQNQDTLLLLIGVQMIIQVVIFSILFVTLCNTFLFKVGFIKKLVTLREISLTLKVSFTYFVIFIIRLLLVLALREDSQKILSVVVVVFSVLLKIGKTLCEEKILCFFCFATCVLLLLRCRLLTLSIIILYTFLL